MSKLQTILKDGLEPFKEGKRNYELNIPEIEDLARERLNTCLGCKFYHKEPVIIFRIKDDRIPELSEMMCGDCGCELPFKTRQNLSICKKWEQ